MITRVKRPIVWLVATMALSLALASGSAPLRAQEVEYQAIELKKLDDGSQALSEDKAYIYIRSTQVRSNGVFLKQPDAQDIEEYDAEWEEEFAKAVKKYPKRIERWRKRASAQRNPGPKPVEPTRDTFAITDIEQRMVVSFGPQYVFSKGKDASGEKFFDYLIEVEPSQYTYYGPLFIGPNGAFGQCYCMGTVKFTAKAGEITSFGDFLMGNWVTPEALSQVSILASALPDRSGKPADYSVPGSLSALPAAPVELFAAGKINNFYRAGVSRFPPLEGVLRYERDIVIDVREEIAKAEAEAARLKAEADAAKTDADEGAATQKAETAGTRNADNSEAGGA